MTTWGQGGRNRSDNRLSMVISIARMTEYSKRLRRVIVGGVQLLSAHWLGDMQGSWVACAGPSRNRNSLR